MTGVMAAAMPATCKVARNGRRAVRRSPSSKGGGSLRDSAVSAARRGGRGYRPAR
jgi:hypothetical protein